MEEFSDALVSFVTAPSVYFPKSGPKLLLISSNKTWIEHIKQMIMDTPMHHNVTVYYSETDDADSLNWNILYSKFATNILIYLNANDENTDLACALSSDPKVYITVSDEDERLHPILGQLGINGISNDSFAQLQRIINGWANEF